MHHRWVGKWVFQQTRVVPNFLGDAPKRGVEGKKRRGFNRF
jgi:hypothetical protein